MDAATYIAACQLTKSNLFITPIFADAPSKRLTVDVAHAIMGLATEVGELFSSLDDGTNQTEEFGDILWYCAVYAHSQGRFAFTPDQTEVFPDKEHHLPVFETALAINSISLELLDMVKKSTFYNREFDYALADHLFLDVYELIEKWTESRKIRISDLFEQNIDKLKTRFPDQFSADRANNRDLESERKTLENYPAGPSYGSPNIINERLRR